MPFGLNNAPSTFRRPIDVIMSTVKRQLMPMYLEDVVVFRRTVEEHLEHMLPVMGLLSIAGASLKMKKRFFFKDRIDHLGHVIKLGRLDISTKATGASRRLPQSTNQSKVKYGLGLCNSFPRIVQNFIRMATTLHCKLEKDQLFTLDD